MSKIDTEEEIEKILKNKPSYPKEMLEMLEKNGLNIPRPTFFRALNRLVKKGKIRKLTKEETLLMGYNLPTGKEHFYVINNKIIEEEKKELIKLIQNNQNIREEITKNIIANELVLYKNYFNKSEEFDVILDFFIRSQDFFTSPLDFFSLEHEFNVFIVIFEKIYNLHDKYKNNNSYEELYEKLKKVTKYFYDYLFFLNKVKKPIVKKLDLIKIIMNLMNKLDILPNIDEFLNTLLERKLSKVNEDKKDKYFTINEIKSLLIEYLNLNSGKLKENLEYLKKIHLKAWDEYLAISNLNIDEIEEKYEWYLALREIREQFKD